MTSRREVFKIRAKILGVLIRDARLASGRSVRESADAVGLSSAAYRSLESGVRPSSIAQLELLAHNFDVPVSHFWNGELLTESLVLTKDPDAFLADRQRSLGTQIRMARKGKGLRQKELAREAGVSRSKLKAYEFGDKPIPLPELEALAETLEMSLEEFLENESPLGKWLAARYAFDRFADLPPDLQAFVAEPHNEPFVRLAMQLSGLPVERLRTVAEGLLDITL